MEKSTFSDPSACLILRNDRFDLSGTTDLEGHAAAVEEDARFPAPASFSHIFVLIAGTYRPEYRTGHLGLEAPNFADFLINIVMELSSLEFLKQDR